MSYKASSGDKLQMGSHDNGHLKRNDFLTRFQVEKLNATTVAFRLHPGDCRLKMIEAANELVIERELIDRQLLQELRLNEQFSDNVKFDEQIVVDGSVKYGYGLSLPEQVQLLQQMELNLTQEHNFAAGFCAFFVLESQPFIAGWVESFYCETKAVRTANSIFRYLPWRGLYRDFNYGDECRASEVSGEQVQVSKIDRCNE